MSLPSPFPTDVGTRALRDARRRNGEDGHERRERHMHEAKSLHFSSSSITNSTCLRGARARAPLVARGLGRSRCERGDDPAAGDPAAGRSGLAAGSIFTFSLTLGDGIAPSLVGGPGSSLIGTVVYDNLGLANNAPFAAAFAMVPLGIMALYLVLMKRLGAFESL